MSFGTVQAEKMTTESGYSLGAGNASSFKNRLINGAQVIDQRNAGASVSIVGGSPKYGTDRFLGDLSTSTGVVYSIQQVSDAPSGFSNSLKVTVTTAGATSASNYSYIRQQIEGYNFADLNFGTANAKTFTLSFWVKASIAGTYGGYFGAALNARFQVFTYTVNSANTWEFKTVTISGDTSGTWNTTNGTGLQVAWSLSCGSTYLGTPGTWSNSLLLGATGQTNITETLNATLAITGTQLEVGTVATSFDFRDITKEYQLCQRYFETTYAVGTAVGTATSTNVFGWYAQSTQNYNNAYYPFKVDKRAAPTVTVYGCQTGASNKVTNLDTNTDIGGRVIYTGTKGTGISADNISVSVSVGIGGHFTASAEL